VLTLILTGVSEAENAVTVPKVVSVSKDKAEGAEKGNQAALPYLSHGSGLERCSVQLYYHSSISHNS